MPTPPGLDATAPTAEIVLHPDRLRKYVERVCATLGSEPIEAGLVADHLVGANLTGHDSHGVGMMPAYVDSCLSGRLHVNGHATVASDSGAVVVLDGNRTFGQVAAHEATALAIERAREHGVALVGLRDSCHIGRVGHWGEQCARAGMVSIHFVNVAGHEPLVAPYGGADARFVTNPMCIAIPGRFGSDGDTSPLVLLDMATSVLTMSKIRVALNKGLPVPENSVIDGDGNPTVDSGGLFADPRRGAILAFGLHKGSGLAIMCELLGAALIGGTTSAPHHHRDGSIFNSMLAIVIDPDSLAGIGALGSEAVAFCEHVRSAPARAGFDEVLLPGEPEQRARAERACGVPIDANTLAELERAAVRAGVAPMEAADLLNPNGH
jgi:uncharacterized oxidoreductase